MKKTQSVGRPNTMDGMMRGVSEFWCVLLSVEMQTRDGAYTPCAAASSRWAARRSLAVCERLLWKLVLGRQVASSESLLPSIGPLATGGWSTGVVVASRVRAWCVRVCVCAVYEYPICVPGLSGDARTRVIAHADSRIRGQAAGERLSPPCLPAWPDCDDRARVTAGRREGREPRLER